MKMYYLFIFKKEEDPREEAGRKHLITAQACHTVK